MIGSIELKTAYLVASLRLLACFRLPSTFLLLNVALDCCRPELDIEVFEEVFSVLGVPFTTVVDILSSLVTHDRGRATAKSCVAELRKKGLPVIFDVINSLDQLIVQTQEVKTSKEGKKSEVEDQVRRVVKGF